MNKLHVATVAVDNAWADVQKNISLTEEHVRHVKENAPETQIILFPEMSLTGYILDETNKDLAEPLDGPSVNAVAKIAKENNVAIIASMIGQGEDNPHNTTFVVDAGGEPLTHYHKNHLFTQSIEPELYAPGTELATFEIGGWRCGLSTCFDIRFPRLFETYKKAGVECMFSPFNWIAGRNKPEIFDFMIKARAHENQFFFAATDRTGSDPNTNYHAVSTISNPFGEEVSTRDGVHSYAALDKKEIELLEQALPLKESFKEKYILKD